MSDVPVEYAPRAARGACAQPGATQAGTRRAVAIAQLLENDQHRDSPHRKEAFEACRFCIDTLKETVPIWKKEVCPDGAFWIEGEDAVAVK